MTQKTYNPAEPDSNDCYILHTTPNTAYDNLELEIGVWPAKDGGIARSLVAFDMTDIPLDQQVLTGTQLTLWQSVTKDCSAYIYALWRLTAEHTEAATWLTRNGTDEWTNEGGDFGPPFATQYGIDNSGGGLNPWLWDSADFRAIVQDALDHRGRILRLLAKAHTEVTDTLCICASALYAPLYQPQLIVVYQPKNVWTPTTQIIRV